MISIHVRACGFFPCVGDDFAPGGFQEDSGYPSAGRRGPGVVFGNASTVDQYKGRRAAGGAGGAPEGQSSAHWARKVRDPTNERVEKASAKSVVTHHATAVAHGQVDALTKPEKNA